MFRLKNVLGYQCLQRCSRFFVLWLQKCIIFFRVSSETRFFTFYFFSTTCHFQNLGPLPLGGLRQWPSGRASPINSYFERVQNVKGMFGNCFFLLFSIFKNNFLFLRLKNLFGNSKWIENKNCSQNSICERNWKQVKCCF